MVSDQGTVQSVTDLHMVDIGQPAQSYPSALRFLNRVSRVEAMGTPGVRLGKQHHIRTVGFIAHALSRSGELVHLAAFNR